MKTRILTATLVLALSACESNESADDAAYSSGMVMMSDAAAPVARQERSRYLAYEHSLSIETDRDDLQANYDTLIEACRGDYEFECTVLDSRMNVGDYASASVRMRMLPAGVEKFSQIAAEGGEVKSRSTHVEDLEDAIVDTDSRIEMLESTRDKLLQIEQQAADDIDSLIKVTSELSRVQSELERLMGRKAHQSQRVNKQLLNVQFQTSMYGSFWAPIGEALSRFGSNLADGISTVISAVAYLLPWAVLLFLLFFGIRKFRNRNR